MQRAARKLSLKLLMVILLSVVLIVVNISVFFIYKQQVKLQESREEVTHSYAVVEQVRVVFTGLLDAETGQRGYLLAGIPIFLQPYKEAKDTLKEKLQRLQFLVRDNPRQRERVTAVVVLSNRLLEIYDGRILKRTLPGYSGINVQSYIETKAMMDHIRRINADVMAEEQALLSNRLVFEKKTEDRFFSTLLISTALSLAVLLIANSIIFLALGRERKMKESLVETQQALDHMNERMSVALRETADGIIEWDVKEGKIVYSPRFTTMLGYEDKDFPAIYESFNKVLHPEDGASFRGLFDQAFLSRHDRYQNIVRLRTSQGSWRWHAMRASIIYDEKGDPERVVVAHTDVTELKTMEEGLRASNKELEEFTYIASHDLRSPLVNLKGFASELALGVDQLRNAVNLGIPQLDPAKQKQTLVALDKDIPMALQFIHSSVARMDRLTNAILDLSRIGRRELKFERLNIQSIVNRCLDTLAHQIEAGKIEVGVENLPDVSGDAVALEQVFGNIIDNAIKYLDPKRAGRIRIYGVGGPSENTYYIADNGRGIAKEDMRKIFEIFRRAGNTTNIPGEGMGMAYIKAILRRHGGDIRCTSEIGVGTTFYFTIANNLRKDETHASD